MFLYHSCHLYESLWLFKSNFKYFLIICPMVTMEYLTAGSPGNVKVSGWSVHYGQNRTFGAGSWFLWLFQETSHMFAFLSTMEFLSQRFPFVISIVAQAWKSIVSFRELKTQKARCLSIEFSCPSSTEMLPPADLCKLWGCSASLLKDNKWLVLGNMRKAASLLHWTIIY